MRQSVLRKSVAVSLVVHSGILGLLLLVAKGPGTFEKPIQIRIVPPPATAPPSTPEPVPQPAPQPLRRPIPKAPPAPPVRSGSSERELRGERIGRPEGSGVSAVPRPAPEEAARPSPSIQGPVRPVPEAVPPPQVAARPTPETVPLPVEPRREFREEPPPERSGLSLSGPPRDAFLPPAPTSPAPRSRPSLRDQIAGLDSGLMADIGGPAKQTISLDDRRPRFLDYLARLKQRVMGEWTYPEDAQRVGVSGDLEIVFTLNPAGTLVYIQLTRSSGFPILDNEALRALKTVAPFEPFPPQMGGEPVNIVAHFIYPSFYRYRRN